MELAVTGLVMTLCVLAAAGVARRTGLPAPLLLLGVGVLGSYLPFVAEPALSPELVLVGILPPLLYASASTTSLVDIRRNAPAIGWLSVGLVVATAAVVGLVVWALLPIPYAAAFALGAVVAPPDAVAATAVARQVGLPRRVVTILEGESLVNDASALVGLRTAIQAVATSVTVTAVLLDFARAVLVAVLAGLLVAKLIGVVLSHTDDTVTQVTLTFVAPFAAYVPAEHLHGSGVLAVVVAGLTLGHLEPIVSTAPARLSGRLTWTTIRFLLENAVFLLIGLQMRRIVAAADESGVEPGRLAAVGAATLATVVLVRIGWVFGSRLLGRIGLRAGGRDRAPARDAVVISWAGMRGVVTLAAALTLPADFPQRPVLVLVALGVTAGTLVLHGLTLPWVARRADVRAPDPREDALQAATVLQRTVGVGLRRADALASTPADQDVVGRLREAGQRRLNGAWEQVGPAVEGQETPAARYRRLRGEALAGEREELLRIRSEGRVDHEVLTGVLGLLDVEESMLLVVAARDAAEGPAAEGPVPVVGRRSPVEPCAHLTQASPCRPAAGTDGCERCRIEGTEPVHLRMCLICGTVGCCDSSVGRHATAHYRSTGHPVMRSIEPGERWRWCYVDEVLGGDDD